MLGLLLFCLDVNSTIPSHFVLTIAKVKFITLSIYSNPFREWQFTLVHVQLHLVAYGKYKEIVEKNKMLIEE
jgi:ssRNA-specific RNase YbeY (16S rRNA maturation enzyme)